MIDQENAVYMPQQEMRKILLKKATDLFSLCDIGGKGFATKTDMQKLQGELHLTPDQLDEVFDTLDKDHNEYLTLDEFTEGFGMYLGIDTQHMNNLGKNELNFDSKGLCPDPTFDEVDANDETEQFQEFLDKLGAQNVFTDEDYIRQMWERVRNDDPATLSNFEEFLEKITSELRNSKKENSSLESTLKNRNCLHNEQVQSLYTEMEEQLMAEREQILQKEKSKEKKVRDHLAEELNLKDQQLQSLLSKHAEMEKQLEELNSEDSETRHENVKLQKERDSLEQRLSASEKMLTDMRGHLQLLRKRSLEEKRKRAQAALRVSEGIALERESLVNELDMLKKVNKQLLDEKDELMLSASNTPLNGSLENSPRSSRQENDPLTLFSHKETSNVTDLLRISPSYPREGSKTSRINSPVDRTPDDMDPLRRMANNDREEDASRHPESNVSFSSEESAIPLEVKNIDCEFGSAQGSSLTLTSGSMHSSISKCEDECEVDESFFQNNPDVLAKDPPTFTLKNNLNLSPKKLNSDFSWVSGASENWDENEREKPKKYNEKQPLSPPHSPSRVSRQTQDSSGHSPPSHPTAKKSASNSSSLSSTCVKKREGETRSPERIFKIVFIGDSGVGKSSFIHRFCHDTFRPTFSATIGVDFQVKSFVVDGRLIALQLWDTAGQERFRSLTKQYFRKADGIIIVYDVTSETSFKNVRNWISNVKEGADEHVVIMLIGNKTDLCERDDDRVVKIKDGNWLADEFGALFFETSAKSGLGVREAVNALSSLLQEKEDEVMERVFQLQESMKPKKKCC